MGMTVKQLKEALQKEADGDEVSVGLDVENKAIVASLSVFRPSSDEVVDIMTEEYSVMGFSTERSK